MLISWGILYDHLTRMSFQARCIPCLGFGLIFIWIDSETLVTKMLKKQKLNSDDDSVERVHVQTHFAVTVTWRPRV